MELQKLIEEYQYAELTDEQMEKVKGELAVGTKVSIKWKGRNYTDKGYLFATPEMDEDPELFDFLVHVPKPYNEDGMDTAPAEWTHINCLLMNNECLSIKCNGIIKVLN